MQSGPQRERLSRVWAGFAHLGDVLLCEVGPNAVVDVVLWSTLHPESIRVCSVASSVCPPAVRTPYPLTSASPTRVPHPHIRVPHLPTSASPHPTSGPLCTLGRRFTVRSGPQRERLSRVWAGFAHLGGVLLCNVGPNAVLGRDVRGADGVCEVGPNASG